MPGVFLWSLLCCKCQSDFSHLLTQMTHAGCVEMEETLILSLRCYLHVEHVVNYQSALTLFIQLIKRHYGEVNPLLPS